MTIHTRQLAALDGLHWKDSSGTRLRVAMAGRCWLVCVCVLGGGGREREIVCVMRKGNVARGNTIRKHKKSEVNSF
jgi:hypothetical protein